MDAQHDDSRKYLTTGLMGLGIALVWLAVVAGFSYWLAAGH